MARRPIVAGNWKMNGWRESLSEIGAIAGIAAEGECEVVLCLPATLVSDAYTLTQGTWLKIGAQTCHARASGAFTGEIAAGMLWDAGASHVIVGHSERRALGETDTDVREKTEAALHAGLFAIVCVGETEEEHDAGRAREVVLGQLAECLPGWASADRVALAYEPVWAIGSGRTPKDEEISEIMRAIRADLEERFGAEAAEQFRLLYGGSVAATNAGQIFAIDEVDGALVGAASLRADDFGPIIAAAG